MCKRICGHFISLLMSSTIQLLMNKRILVALSLQLGLLLMVIGVYICLNPWSWQSKSLLEIMFMFVVFQSLVLHTNFHGTWKNIDNLFIAFFVFFLGTRFLFDFFSDKYNVCFFEFFLARQVSVNVVNRAVFNLMIALCSYNIGGLLWRYFSKSYRKDEFIPSLESEWLPSNKVVYALLGVGVLAKLYYSYQVFMAMLTYGYLSFFTDGFSINRNLAFMFAETFYEIAIFIIICRKEKMRKWEAFFIFLYIGLSMATGQRGFGMLSVVFFIFYLVKAGKMKINIMKLFLIVVFLFLFSVVVGNIRSDKELDFTSVFSYFFDFFYGQAISITVLVSTIDYISQIDFSFWDLFGHIRYLLEYYWEKITLQTPVPIDALTLQAEEYKWYGQYISCLTNPDMYYRGLGTGSSYVGQLFAVGKEGAQFLGGMFVGYLAGVFYHYLSSPNFLKRFYAFHALTVFIFIPRANLFEFVSMQWAPYVTSLFIYFFILMGKRKKSVTINCCYV